MIGKYRGKGNEWRFIVEKGRSLYYIEGKREPDHMGERDSFVGKTRLIIIISGVPVPKARSRSRQAVINPDHIG